MVVSKPELLKKMFIDNLNDYKDDILASKYPEDILHETADSHIPVYTSDLLEVALDDLTLAAREPEILAFDGQATAVNAIAGNLYDDLLELGYQWLEEQKQTNRK